jgi:two-component system sensor histidine kinase TctE
VLLPALLVVGASAMFDYYSTASLAQHMQDDSLRKTASALATRMAPDEDGENNDNLRRHLSPSDAALLRADPIDDLHFVVFDDQQQVLAGEPRLRALAPQPLPEQAQPDYSDQLLDAHPVRVITLRHQAHGISLTVLMTESHRKRRAATNQILINAVWPNLALLIVMLALMQRGITRALRPLRALSRAIDQRAAQDLTPIAQHHVLAEIQPLVAAINGMLARLQQATAQQQVFLSSAAHQLRTPLTSIQTQLELAAQEAPATLRPRLDRLRSAVRDLTHCTRQMLALARSSAHASTAHDFETVDLPSLIEDAASLWLDVALSRQVELCFELTPAQATGSPWMLQELLGNLIDNATQHSPAGSPVTVRCGLDANQHPYLEVQDAGPGIAPSQRPQVFEPFYRNPQTRHEGSGLGLSIVREVAERHAAQVSFIDLPGAIGTCLRVTLPRTAAA